MEPINSSEKVFVKESVILNAGRGVFAKQSIDNGELIESCPIIEVLLKDPANDEKGLLVDYFFYFGNELAVALGFGSIYNHSYKPNATYKKDLTRKKIDFIAIKDINEGEEITVNYNYGNPNDQSKPTVRGVPNVESFK